MPPGYVMPMTLWYGAPMGMTYNWYLTSAQSRRYMLWGREAHRKPIATRLPDEQCSTDKQSMFMTS
jgi:hypothetical protein